MPAKALRVSLHPWVWWMIVKRALISFTGGELTVENRRRMAVILGVLEDGLDPDDVVFESPYARLSKNEADDREKRNQEILKECGYDENRARCVQGEMKDGKAVYGWRPRPAPRLRVFLTFAKEDLRVVENAVEAYAKRTDVDHSFDRGFVDALDAFKNAEEIELVPMVEKPKEP